MPEIQTVRNLWEEGFRVRFDVPGGFAPAGEGIGNFPGEILHKIRKRFCGDISGSVAIREAVYCVT